jgi:pimeloyl-ACP methyl ester carboxylesterase
MHGDTDKLISAEAGRKFAAAIPGSQLIIYEKVGHVPMEHVPDKSAADLDAWHRAKVRAAKP